MVLRLPGKHKALSTILGTKKKKEGRKKDPASKVSKGRTGHRETQAQAKSGVTEHSSGLQSWEALEKLREDSQPLSKRSFKN